MAPRPESPRYTLSMSAGTTRVQPLQDNRSSAQLHEESQKTDLAAASVHQDPWRARAVAQTVDSMLREHRRALSRKDESSRAVLGQWKMSRRSRRQPSLARVGVPTDP